MAVNSLVAVGLRGVQSYLANVSTTPIAVLDNPLPIGRHMIIIASAITLEYLGSLDILMVPGARAHTISTSENCMTNYDGNESLWSFTYGNALLTFRHDGTALLVKSSIAAEHLLVREFLIPNTYSGDNLYGIDQIHASNPATGAPLTISSPLELSTVLENACNLGQAAVTQTSLITSAVTANGSSGIITTVSAATASLSTNVFTVNNTAIAASSAVVASVCGYSGTDGVPAVTMRAIASGSFDIHLTNLGVTPLNGIVTISFIAA